MWRVTALTDNDTEYVYVVEAPRDAVEMDVVTSAYAQHGEAVRSGELSEYLSPRYLLEWVDDAH